MKATTGERPHIKISAALRVNDVQISMASQSSGGSKQSTMKVEQVTERIVQEYLLALVEKLVTEGCPDSASDTGAWLVVWALVGRIVRASRHLLDPRRNVLDDLTPEDALRVR